MIPKAQPQRDMRRVWIDAKDCERMNRRELLAMKWMIAMNCTAYTNERDLAKRLESVPYGRQRMRMTIGGFRAIVDDLIGTLTTDQARVLQNTMHDYDVRLVPKGTPQTSLVMMEKQEVQKLVDCAREKCKGCVEDGEGCRKCQLYQVLEVSSPLDDYGDGLVCPYSLADWD